MASRFAGRSAIGVVMAVTFGMSTGNATAAFAVGFRQAPASALCGCFQSCLHANLPQGDTSAGDVAHLHPIAPPHFDRIDTKIATDNVNL